MSFDGQISVEIERISQNSGRVSRVAITSGRRTDISSFLHGRSTQEAISMLPMVFNICGKAHALAARQACGEPVDSGCLSVLCENAREHILRIITGWNVQNGSDIPKADLANIINIVARMDALAIDDLVGIRHIIKVVRRFLNKHIFHMPVEQWLELHSDGQLVSWAENTPSVAGKFIEQIYLNDWQGVGAVPPQFLPEISGNQLGEKMHTAAAGDFVSRPQWLGQCCETGPLARNRTHRLVKTLIEKYGAGLLARQVARLVELAKIPGQMEAHLTHPQPAPTATGFGQVETARGRLLHSAIVQAGVIRDYKILAPTEWNFHPQGVLHESLWALQADDASKIQQLGKMLIEAIDPCVGYELRVN